MVNEISKETVGDLVSQIIADGDSRKIQVFESLLKMVVNETQNDYLKFISEWYYLVPKKDMLDEFLGEYRKEATIRWKKRIKETPNPSVEEARTLEKGLEHILTADNQTLLEDYINNRDKRLEEDNKNSEIDYKVLFESLLPSQLI